MDMIWSQARMCSLLQSLFTISNVRVGFFDVDGREIMAYPGERTRYCTLIRSTRAGDDACLNCDRAAYEYVSRSHQIHIYPCHAGLTEMIAPITAKDDQLLGYLMIGQVRPRFAEAQPWNDVKCMVEGLPLDTNLLRTYYDELPIMGEEQVKASAKILQALAAYVWLDNFIHIQNKPLAKRVESYIHSNVEKNLTLEHLCKVFDVSKTTLCTSVKNELEVTVTALIHTARVEVAQQLLQSTDLPMSAVAERVGIRDYNYFTKVFKQETSVTPSVYRRLCENQHG